MQRKSDLLQQSFYHGLKCALLAAVLALPFIALRLDEGEGGLVVATRWPEFLFAVGLVFAFFFAKNLFPKRESGVKESLDRITLWLQKHESKIGALLLFIALLLPFLPFSSRYVIDLATTVLIYAMLGWGLNIVVGMAGLLDLGYVAFYGIGAYTLALTGEYWGLSFWQALPLSALFAVFASVLIGLPVLRLRGDYLAIVTLGFAEIFRIFLINWQSFTHGPSGISGIQRPTFFGLAFQREAEEGTRSFHDFFGLEFSTQHRVVFLYFLILALALLTNFIVLRIRQAPIGRAFEAMRDNEIASRSLGISPTAVKLCAYAIGAGIAGLAGCFFAARQGFVSPESFTFVESAMILAIVVLAGAGSQLGVLLAAIILVSLPELLRDFSALRMLFFGAMMVLMMVWRPRGIFALRKPGILFGQRGRQ